MVWFLPGMGILALLIVGLAWLSDRRARRHGLEVDANTIARNLKAFKQERRLRLRRRWIPLDTEARPDQPEWRNR